MENAPTSGPELAGRVADSMAAAAAALALDVELVATAKRLGCLAFRGSRVYLDELEDWLDNHGQDLAAAGVRAADEVDLAIRRERLRKLKFENEIAEGRYMAAADVADEVKRLGRELRNRLRTVLENELPAKLQGAREEEIRGVMRKTVDQLCQAFRAGAGKWE